MVAESDLYHETVNMSLKAVLIDTNDATMAPWLKSLDLGAPTLVQPLPCGDCWLAVDGVTIIVERKTLQDFLASIDDGRLFDQCARMIATSPWSYVVITDYPSIKGHRVVVNKELRDWKDHALQGALLTVQELGVGVIYCDGETDYAPTLKWLVGRERGDVHIKARRPATEAPLQEQVLWAFKCNLGEVHAQALMKQYNSLARVLVALTKLEGNHTPGIGTSTKQAVRAVMQLAPDEEVLVAKGGLTAVDFSDIDGATLGTIMADNLGSQALAKICEKANELDELRGIAVVDETKKVGGK